MHTDSDIQQVFHNRYDITEIESSGRSTILLLTSRRVLFQQLFMNYAAILGIVTFDCYFISGLKPPI